MSEDKSEKQKIIDEAIKAMNSCLKYNTNVILSLGHKRDIEKILNLYDWKYSADYLIYKDYYEQKVKEKQINKK